jgi:hypothetical protein
MPLLKRLILAIILLIALPTQSVEIDKSNQLEVNITRVGSIFHIKMSFQAELSACNAFQFITDYENMKKITGVRELKVASRKGNKVLVERVVEERVLGFPIVLFSQEEFTEVSLQRLSFEQIQGDAKFYRGTWNLTPLENRTKFEYESQFELDSYIPNVVINYFIKNNIQSRFEQMVQLTKYVETHPYLACR